MAAVCMYRGTSTRTYVELFESKDGWRFRVKARNGKIIGASESYTRKHDAKRAARREQPTASIFVR